MIEDIPQDKLVSLGEFAKEASTLTEEISDLENKLKIRSERLRFLTEVSMPEIMMEIGMEQIKLLTGEKCTMTKFYAPSIPPETQEQAFAWLRQTGNDSIIKNKVEASFGKGEDEKVNKLMEQLIDYGFTCKTSVHPMTLKSFVKEQMESGNSLPDSIKVHVGNKVKIK
ncbi:hypothetical protein UFOVP1090_17 [uncultured Caudovirales phage]|uniref:Uncharacterized protein n=1 Tax=uncultured Caudovirales phage TaxID=2100421 RepID=A0A6J5QE48_9CAUD|nr:hypothetical protein UFOVP1090_17 [uncultured Caudovirales phage]